MLQGGNAVGAAEMFKQALARDQGSVNAWINLGDSYNAMGHHAEAMSAYTRAGQLDGASAAVRVRLAAEYQAIGDTASARRHFDEALHLDASDPSVHYNFGKFLQAQHDLAGALREYQLFVDLAPGKFSPENIDLIRKHIVALSSARR
jgi:Tfp pilus assembly protein PilF